MASMPQPTASLSRRPMAQQRVTLLVLLIVGLAAGAGALIVAQRQFTVPVAPASSIPTSASDQNRAIVAAYEQLHFQRLAAEQATRAGNADAYEIAVSGAEALQSRIATLQATRQAVTELDRAVIDAYEQLHFQRLAAEQALRAGNADAYETAVSGGAALQSRIAALQARRPQA